MLTKGAFNGLLGGLIHPGLIKPNYAMVSNKRFRGAAAGRQPTENGALTIELSSEIEGTDLRVTLKTVASISGPVNA